MLERTQTPPTDSVLITFVVPPDLVVDVRDFMRQRGITEKRDSVPWREVLTYSDAEMPGVLLSGARYREELTQAKLAEKTGIPRRHISEMENGHRPIGKKNARILAQALNIDPRLFLSV